MREKAAVAVGPHAGREHVVASSAEAEEADRGAREDDDRVAEQGLAGERGKHLRDDPHRRQDEDVDLGVAEVPEEVLPEDRHAPVRDLEEIGAEEPVHHDLDERDRDRGEGEESCRNEADVTPNKCLISGYRAKKRKGAGS